MRIMTVKELALQSNLTALNDFEDKEIKGVYCCDLLSVVMSKAFSGCAWVTVMGNINSIAVASLVDMACIILAENAVLDDAALEKANKHNIAVLKADKPVFETALAVHSALENA